MPDYAPDFTPRYRVEYVSAGVHHHVTLRGFRDEPAGTTTSRAQNALVNMLTPLVVVIPADFNWISAEYIPQDTEIGVPASIPLGVTGTAVVADMTNQDKATSLGWVGRSAATPMRVFFFGVQLNPDVLPANITSDFRIQAGESAAFASSIAALNGSGLPANNNLPGSWKQYVNVKPNDYWLKQIRKLGGI